MNALASAVVNSVSDRVSLPALIDRAVRSLANARTAAEVLEARDLASVAYDVAKKTARLAKAKQAHDEVIAAAYRAQADALEIDAQAKRRLADEYDAAQERGEIRANGERSFSNPEKVSGTSVVPPKELHEGRLIRDAEQADPGVVRRTVDEAVAAGEEPSKAKVRRAVLKVVKPDAGEPSQSESAGERLTQSTPNSRFLNIAWDAEHRAGDFDFSAMTNYGELAAAAERVAGAWEATARELRRLEAS